MKEPNKDEQVLQHIVRYCNQVETTVKHFCIERAEFEDNFVYQNALSMPILQIGELVKKLSPEFRQVHLEIPWRAIAGMRDHLAHDYAEMDVDVAWEAITEEIPELREYCKRILEKCDIPIPKPERL